MKNLRLTTALCATLALSALAPVSESHARSRHEQCPADLKCDETWDMAFNYVENFCKNGLAESALDGIEELIVDHELSRWSVEVLLNTYGAMYGYEFKKLKHLNKFFYDKDAARWLPAACVPLIKSKAANKMPLHLTKARDSLRRLYDKHFKDAGSK